MPFSFSQLSTYRTCPAQYEFASIKKIPRSISAGESFGSSVHNTLSRFGKREIENGKLKIEKDQLSMFEESEETSHFALSTSYLIDLWHQSFIVQGYENKDDADRAREKGEVLMQKYFDWWSQMDREVVAIEKGFSIGIDVNVIKGRFDRVEKVDGSLVVIDYKTGSIRSQEEVDNDLQLSIYAIAAEQVFDLRCTNLVLLFLHEDGMTEVVTQRSDKQLSEARTVIGSLAEGIDEVQFEPLPSESVCKRCPYRGICDAAAV